jgi:WD40 repeat protein
LLQDNKVRLYKVTSDKSLEDTSKSLSANGGAISALAYSPDGSLLAVGDAQRKIVVYDTQTGSVKIDQWVFHNSRVNSVAWSPDGAYAVSGSLDTNLILWTVADPFKKSILKSKM